jgi:hypothetical protein
MALPFNLLRTIFESLIVGPLVLGIGLWFWALGLGIRQFEVQPKA